MCGGGLGIGVSQNERRFYDEKPIFSHQNVLVRRQQPGIPNAPESTENLRATPNHTILERKIRIYLSE